MRKRVTDSTRRIFLALVVSSIAMPVIASVDQKTLIQRQLYLDAEKALNKGHHRKLSQLKKKLQDYPLYPYLEYEEIRKNLGRVKQKTVHRYLHDYPGTPRAISLHYRWLKTLARKKQWQALIDNFYYTSDKELQCDFARALLITKQDERAYSVLEGLWLTGRSLPKKCDTPIENWHRSGKLSQQLVWERIRLAMQSRRSRLALHLSRYLQKDQQFWVRVWAKVRRDPNFVVSVYDRFKNKDSQALRWIIGDGLRRMAHKDAKKAAQIWEQWHDKFRFTQTEKDRIERRLALNVIKEDPSASHTWLSQLRLNTSEERINELYILTAFQDQDWNTAMDWLNRLDVNEKHSERWRYWRARALEGMGRLDEARAVYLLNADSRGYYGFLSADRAGTSYQLGHKPVISKNSDLIKIAQIPAVERARELYALKRNTDARREWAFALKQFSKPQLLDAAHLAHEWGWHDRAIVTFAQAKYWDDLEKRFPLAHRSAVLSHASKQKINPAWAFAIIRQESAFTYDARSHAGAMGLMQLLPTTARQVARSLSLRFRRNDLLNADTNVQLGINYLKYVKDHFNGNKVLATAAYNAGEHRVGKWLPESGVLPADVWVEAVPFNETREYLKRVLTYTVIYEQRLGKQPVPLMDRMLPIPGKITVLSSGTKPKSDA